MTQGVYANVIVDISLEKLDRPFQYRIPDELKGKITAGTAVIVPFGAGNRELAAYVTEVTDRAEIDPAKIKDILRISEKRPTVETNQIRLAGWMKEHYGSTMIAALKTVLPVQQKNKTPERRRIRLLVGRDEAAKLLEEYNRKHQSARARLVAGLLDADGVLPYEKAIHELSVTLSVIRAMEQKEIVRIESETAYRNPVNREGRHREPVVLSAAQRHIAEDILTEYRDGHHGTYLIHGITGSGKTEVYMELIQGMIDLGRQSIVLIPEIGLTYQTVSRFTQRFGQRVSVLHSRLSIGERSDQCERARRGEIDVMIGPRSALFTPFEKLGLIIIDEEQESSYKSEPVPKYHARETAEELASYYGASVVLGSATPSMESYYRAEKGEIKRYELTERLTGGSLPEVYVEDLREELEKGNRSIFSRRLQKLMEQKLAAGEQIMLFLNRRGYAGFVSCRSCGHVMKCPHCDVSLSEHRGGRLVCHYCGYEQPAVDRCPSCGSKYISGFKAGTQQVEELVHKRFPQARVLRMDADTTRKKDSYQEILSSFERQEADILIGTQMIVKGHDFPGVTLVGILAADLSLHANDYRAGERTFQLLTQAAGRAGRGRRPGQVVIQTYQPEHHSVRYAADQDYRGFYQEELIYRELMEYPPAAHMLAVLILSSECEKGEALAKELAGQAEAFAKESCASAAGAAGQAAKFGASAAGAPLRILGPTPASVGRVSDIFRHVLYAKCREERTLIALKDRLEAFLDKKEGRKEIVQFDFDPMNLY